MEDIEVKEFDEYSIEEQKSLLLHWWYYYRKSIFSLAELKKFGDIVNKDPQHALDMAVVSSINNRGSDALIGAMGTGRFEELEDIVRKIVDKDAYLKIKKEAEEIFLTKVVSSFNGRKSVISEDKVRETYLSCLFKHFEFEDGLPLCDFSVGEGIRSVGVFNTERLNKDKSQILDMIEHIDGIYLQPHFTQLCFYNDGKLWTTDYNIVDMLVQLGIAAGILEYNIPSEIWDDELPYVCINNQKRYTEIIGEKPSEYVKIISKYKGN